MLFLGIDVGTGGTRAVVIDTDGRIVAAATVEHAPFASPHLNWAEHDPRDWWRAAAGPVRTAIGREEVDAAAVAAARIPGQLHGARVLDGRAELLRASSLAVEQ